MNKETIEKAADDYSVEIMPAYSDGYFERYQLADAFEYGAQWRIDSVWHDASESPRTGDRIIVIDEDYHIVDVGYFGNSDRIMDGHRWAYINDLLPNRKEE